MRGDLGWSEDRDRRGVFPDIRWYEDFVVGQRFEYGAWEMNREAMLEFARVYDPEPFHLDEAAARALGWDGLTASGNMVGAIWRRLSKDAFPNAETVASPGWDAMEWRKPVYAGDLLASRTEVVETRRLRSRPAEGLVKTRNEMTRSGDELVALIISNWFVRRRPAE